MNLNQIALGLSIFTVAYNILEGAVSVIFSRLDSSAALLGFGVDSFVESFSGVVMVWRFSKPSEGHREQVAARLVGVSLLMLAAYVAYEAIAALAGIEHVERSPAGLIISAASLLVMPPLLWAKRRTARQLGSRSLAADAMQTLTCMLLSVALLIGSGMNYCTGIWQADSVAALLIAVFLLREGYEAVMTKEMCHC
jgi:divalent metal cation (Fe/Co/Zn/Cd) transporter